MRDNENKKGVEELADDALDDVTGGKSCIIQPSPASRLRKTPASTGTNLSEAAMGPGLVRPQTLTAEELDQLLGGQPAEGQRKR